MPVVTGTCAGVSVDTIPPFDEFPAGTVSGGVNMSTYFEPPCEECTAFVGIATTSVLTAVFIFADTLMPGLTRVSCVAKLIFTT